VKDINKLLTKYPQTEKARKIGGSYQEKTDLFFEIFP